MGKEGSIRGAVKVGLVNTSVLGRNFFRENNP